jgi:hypothetical protein
VDLPDSDSFILKVSGPSGTLYEGKYGDSPESLLLESGTYTVRVVSREFSTPAFSAPQFGDEQVVVVAPGASTRVKLDCSQMNSGIRLRFDSDFKSSYPSGYLTVSSADGSLKYASTEQRIGFFAPGSIEITLNDGSSSSRLMTRFVEAREMLTLGISCPDSFSGGEGESHSLSIAVDTTRYWMDEDYTIGSGSGGSPGADKTSAYSVSQAREHVGEQDVWVCGYIVGGDLSSTKTGIKLEPPFTSQTNIAIASRSSVTDKSSCLSVQINKGSIRDALNLVDNPSLIGRKVYLKGSIVEAYYGIPGIQNISEYSF